MFARQTEVSIYVGLSITGILYGILLCLTFSSVYFLALGKTSSGRRYFYVAYSLTLLVLLTCSFSTYAYLGQLMWINERDYPGGPYSYYTATSDSWFQILGTSTDVLANMMSDALLVIISSLPTDKTLAHSINFYIPWISLSSGLNCIVTALIVFRILLLSYRVRRALPSESHGVYTSVAAILIESALPFTVLGVIYAVYSGRNEPPQNALGFIWGTFIVRQWVLH
ncbi:hypothetical protein CVT26_009892 [Gymnopilus dilepis]|uniref:Uncharacterized protein n=1 Tax=Gymnopilus dilepis TaxID=231916 RepID=A0A409YC41_9AGAR|nr:hypothetical protein CVT26_009892 [Gymnopilus dilepis]